MALVASGPDSERRGSFEIHYISGWAGRSTEYWWYFRPARSRRSGAISSEYSGDAAKDALEGLIHITLAPPHPDFPGGFTLPLAGAPSHLNGLDAGFVACFNRNYVDQEDPVPGVRDC